MGPRPKPFLAPDECSYEGALEKKCEHALHRQGLANDRPGVLGERRPICPELEFHRNSSDDPYRKVESKNFGPEPRCSVVFFFSGPKSAPFPIDHEPGKSHGQLWKQIMVSNSEPEMNAMPKSRVGKRVIHVMCSVKEVPVDGLLLVHI